MAGLGLTDEQAFPIFDTIKQELAKAWLAGCAAGSGNDQEAA